MSVGNSMCNVKKYCSHATQLLHTQFYKMTVICSLLPPDCEARIWCCTWCQKSVFNCLLDPEIAFYSDEVWFTLSGHVNGQYTKNSSCSSWSAILKGRLWCTISDWRKVQRSFYKIINSKLYIRLVLTLFSDRAKKKSYGHFMQDNAIAHNS